MILITNRMLFHSCCFHKCSLSGFTAKLALNCVQVLSFGWLALLVRRRAQDGHSVHIGNRFPLLCSLSLFLSLQITTLLFGLPSLFLCFLFLSLSLCNMKICMILFPQTTVTSTSSNSLPLFCFCSFSLSSDLWQKVRAAVPAASQHPSWFPCPPLLLLLLCLRLRPRLGPTTLCPTASQGSCLPTWKRWRYFSCTSNQRQKRWQTPLIWNGPLNCSEPKLYNNQRLKGLLPAAQLFNNQTAPGYYTASKGMFS